MAKPLMTGLLNQMTASAFAKRNFMKRAGKQVYCATPDLKRQEITIAFEGDP